MQKILYLGKKSDVSKKYEELGYTLVYPWDIGISPYILMQSPHTRFVVAYSDNIEELIATAFRACYYLHTDAKLLLHIKETNNPCFKKNMYEVTDYESLFKLQNTEDNLWTIPFVTKKHNEMIMDMMVLKHNNPCIGELLEQFGSYEKTVDYCLERIENANRLGYDIELAVTEVPILKQSYWRIVLHHLQDGETIIEGDSYLDRYKYKKEHTAKDVLSSYLNLVYYETFCTDIAEEYHNTSRRVLRDKILQHTIETCHPETKTVIPQSASDEAWDYDEYVESCIHERRCY